MKIIAYETCRVTVLFPYEEVIPLAGVNDRQIIEGIATRYHFLRSPDLVGDDVSKNGYKFEGGQFSFDSVLVRIADFAVYRDGIVINATRTEHAEAFLDDIIGYMKTEHSYRDLSTPPRRYFQSQVVVEFDKSPEKLIHSLSTISSIISEPLKGIYGTEISMKLARIDFDTDKAKLSAPATATVHRFIIERRTGIPFEKERYFCSAPMRTASHLAVLQKIESTLS